MSVSTTTLVDGPVRPANNPAAVKSANEYLHYVDVRNVAIGVVLTFLTAPILYHFVGVLWTVVLVVFTLACHAFRLCTLPGILRGDRTMMLLSMLASVTLVAVWVCVALALWHTGNPVAWVTAVVIATSLTLHVTFSGQNDFRLIVAILAIPALPLLYFMIYASWIEYPTWIAVSATLSSCTMVLGIFLSARLAMRNYNGMRKAIEDARGAQQRLAFAIESAGDGYFEIDLQKLTYQSNPTLALSLGIAPGEKDVSVLRERLHPEDLVAAGEAFRRCVSGKASGWDQDLRIKDAYDRYRWMYMRARVLQEGTRRVLLGTLIDLSDRKAMEEELRTAKEAAESSNRAKSEFLANMSHEIRTPLNGVLGMAQALATDELKRDQKEMIDIILDSGNTLTALLNDVLDLSKIEAGKLEISPVNDDLIHTMERTLQLFEAQASEKGLSLSTNYDPALPRELFFDPIRVRQCIGNLLSNAIKFTEQGSIEICVSSTPLGPQRHLVSVSISDTGIGMSDSVLERLFSAFTQADGATTRRYGGTGLGLAISRQLARLMDGDLEVNSREGLGSTFSLTFQSTEVAQERGTAAQPETIEAAPQGSMHGLRVLLTDDNPTNRQVVRLFLAPLGCVIEEAENGSEALIKLAAQTFDIVLLDAHMPVMDGSQTIRSIRNSSGSWRAIPVIALTADAMSGDREKYLALGVNDYVPKPVDSRELITKMHQVLQMEAGQPQRQLATG